MNSEDKTDVGHGTLDAPKEEQSPCLLKERILLAAIEEFGRCGYAAASTNVVVNNAGVSKGLLFHYYGSKKKLFMECAHYVIKKMESYILGHLNFSNDDMFDRIKRSLEVKMQFCREYPVFMGLAYNLWQSGHRPMIEEYMRKHADNIPDYHTVVLLKGTDMSKLNDGMNVRQVMPYIGMLLDACWNRFADKYGHDPYKIGENTGEYLAEANFVLDMIRRGVYR